MIRYTIRRLLWGCIVILAVTLSVFLLAGHLRRVGGPFSLPAAPVRRGKTRGPPRRGVRDEKTPPPQQTEGVGGRAGGENPSYAQYAYPARRLILAPPAEEKARLCPGA